jgi:hypothetical protein
MAIRKRKQNDENEDEDNERPSEEELRKRMDSLKMDANIQDLVIQLVNYEDSVEHPSDVIAASFGGNGKDVMAAIVTAGSFIAHQHGHTWNQPFYPAQPCDVVTSMLLMLAVLHNKLGANPASAEEITNLLPAWLDGIDLSVLDKPAAE